MEKINNYYTGIGFGIFKIVCKDGAFYKIKSLYKGNFRESYVVNAQLNKSCRSANKKEIVYFKTKEKETCSAVTDQVRVTK